MKEPACLSGPKSISAVRHLFRMPDAAYVASCLADGGLTAQILSRGSWSPWCVRQRSEPWPGQHRGPAEGRDPGGPHDVRGGARGAHPPVARPRTRQGAAVVAVGPKGLACHERARRCLCWFMWIPQLCNVTDEMYDEALQPQLLHHAHDS